MKAAQFHPYPPSYWDAEASEWDRIVAMPTNPHQFYYCEADLLLSEILTDSMRVLELGCGTGGSTAIHASQVRQLVATDFSKEMVRRTARKLRRRRAPVPHFATAEACRLPFRDASFDAVIGRGVLLSYVEEPEAMLAEVHRLLRPGGKVGLDAMNRIRGANPKVTRGFAWCPASPATWRSLSGQDVKSGCFSSFQRTRHTHRWPARRGNASDGLATCENSWPPRRATKVACSGPDN